MVSQQKNAGANKLRGIPHRFGLDHRFGGNGWQLSRAGFERSPDRPPTERRSVVIAGLEDPRLGSIAAIRQGMFAQPKPKFRPNMASAKSAFWAGV